MHYKDGTEAKLGDIVQGTGYNVKAGNVPKVIVGHVVGLTPGSSSCNIQVAHLITVPLPEGHPPHDFYQPKGVRSQDGKFGLVADREYGQCDAFELVHRAAVLLAMLLSLLVFGGAAVAQQGAAPQKPADAPPQVDTAEIGRWGDRVVVSGEGPRDGGELLYTQAMAPPEDDSDQWYITVYGSSRDPASLGVVKGFASDPHLAHFTATPPGQKRPWAHFNFYQVDDRTQRFRFEEGQIAMTGPWPIITIQPPRKGTFGDPRVVVDRIEAKAIGKPEELRRRIQSSVALYCKKLQRTARLDRPGGHQQAVPDGVIGGPASFPWGPEVPPAVPQVNPQWPLNGPANDVPAGATLEQLLAACPGAPIEFLAGQLKAKATLESAALAWQYLKSKLVEPAEPPKPKDVAKPTVDPKPVVTPAPSESLGPWLRIAVALFGSDMVLRFALPFLQGWVLSAKKTPGPLDDIVSGFVLKAVETRLKVEPSASPDSPRSGV